MLLIGLTGPSGAGKGLFCKVLKEYGIESIDADAVYHSLLIPPSPCLDALCNAFGKDILNQDQTLNRRRLADIVFSSEDPVKKAEQMLCFFIRTAAEIISAAVIYNPYMGIRIPSSTKRASSIS